MPRPWENGAEQQLFKNALDQVELVDRLGVDFAWMLEHQFLEEYSHCPAPEVFLGAANQRTKDARLGHGIIQLTINHNARVAERVATLDLIGDGRVEFGMGEGGSFTEFGPFDRTIEAKREVWENAVRAVMPMFADSGFEYDGPHFSSRCATSCRSRCRSRTRRSGSPVQS